jgi:hypothetical protein
MFCSIFTCMCLVGISNFMHGGFFTGFFIPIFIIVCYIIENLTLYECNKSLEKDILDRDRLIDQLRDSYRVLLHSYSSTVGPRRWDKTLSYSKSARF